VKTCGRGGYVVDATKALPADETVLHVVGLPVVGCSRLRCARCKASVRNVTKLALARRELTDAERATLYERADLASSALLRPGYGHFRLYVCRCSHWLETSEHTCDELEPDRAPYLHDDGEPPPAEVSDARPRWRCEGHPSLALPQDIDGVAVASHAELRDLALRALQESLPPLARPQDSEPGVWLARLHARLAPEDAAIVVSAARAALEDAAPRTRASALAFLKHAAPALAKGANGALGDERAANATPKAAAAPARALDDPRLQQALDSRVFRETLADSSDALGRFLRAAGAFAYDWYEEIDFTDWNGAIVGRGAGELLRAAIPPSADLPYSELAPLLEMGEAAREIVARHPSTPTSAPAPPAKAAPAPPAKPAPAPREAPVLTRQASFALGHLPADTIALLLRQAQTDAAGGTTDPALRHAVDFARRALGIEASIVLGANARLQEIIRAARLVLPPVPTALPEVATFLEEMAGAVALAEPSVRAAWQAGVVARDLLVALRCVAHASYLRCAAPFDPGLASTAAKRAAEVRKAAAAWPESVASLGLPSDFPLVLPYLAPTTAEGYRALSEAATTLRQTFTAVEAALATAPPATRRERLAQRFRLVRSFEALTEAMHLAEDVTSDDAVALWTFRPPSRLSRDVRDALVREAMRWMDVGAHPHVVRVREVRTEDDQLCVLSDYIAPAEGHPDPSLRRWLGQALPLHQALALALGIARGMKAVKTRAPDLVHRNLRPENVLVGRDGDAKVTAFGFVAGGVDRTAYMAPEELEGHADERSEIYAFGLVVLEMLTGKRGVDATTLAGAVQAHVAGHAAALVRESQLPPALATWLLAVVDVDAARRPDSWFTVESQLVRVWTQVLGGMAPAPRTAEDASRAQTTQDLWSRVAVAEGFAALGKNDEAKARYRAVFARATSLSERAVEAAAGSGLGLVLVREGDLEGGLAQLEAALAILVELGAVREQALARANIADLLCQLGDLPGAAATLRKCVAAWRALRDVKGEGLALRSLAQMVRRGGWLEEAHACSQAAVACFSKLGDRANEALELSALGHTLRALRRDADATVCFQQSLAMSEQLGDALLTGSNCFALATMTPATPPFARLGRDLATRSAAAFRRAGRNDLAGDADALITHFTAGGG
jgi:hypothetical protein